MPVALLSFTIKTFIYQLDFYCQLQANFGDHSSFLFVVIVVVFVIAFDVLKSFRVVFLYWEWNVNKQNWQSTDIVGHIHMFSNIAFDFRIFGACYFFEDKHGCTQYIMWLMLHSLTDQYFAWNGWLLHSYVRIVKFQMAETVLQFRKGRQLLQKFGQR